VLIACLKITLNIWMARVLGATSFLYYIRNIFVLINFWKKYLNKIVRNIFFIYSIIAIYYPCICISFDIRVTWHIIKLLGKNIICA